MCDKKNHYLGNFFPPNTNAFGLDLLAVPKFVGSARVLEDSGEENVEEEREGTTTLVPVAVVLANVTRSSSSSDKFKLSSSSHASQPSAFVVVFVADDNLGAVDPTATIAAEAARVLLALAARASAAARDVAVDVISPSSLSSRSSSSSSGRARVTRDDGALIEGFF